jgi:uncharacterized protein (DUF1778 family)
METKVKTSDKARFDAKLSKEQKEYFQYAASLGGFHTLTEFVIYSVQEKAKSIIKEHNTILASQRDKVIFFNALMSPKKPNEKLQKAAKRYKDAANKK